MTQNNHGKVHVSLDAAPEKETAFIPEAVRRRDPHYFSQPVARDAMPFLGFLRVWLRLSPIDRDLLAAFIIGEATQTELGHLYGITPQAIQQRLLSAANKFPEVRAALRPRIRALRA